MGNTTRCALLDERDVYLGVVEIDPDAATDRHLLEICDCDLPPGEYRWDREQHAFVPLPAIMRACAGRPTIEHAIAFDMLDRYQRGHGLPEVSLLWLDDVIQTFDFASMRESQLIAHYALERGITFGPKE